MNDIIDHRDGVPPIKNFAELDEKIQELPGLIDGILSKTQIFAIDGPPRIFKTWALMDLALSVASGIEWLRARTKRGRVLYVNLGLQEPVFLKRLDLIREAKGISQRPDTFFYWNIRGYNPLTDNIVSLIIEKVECQDFSMIILDPIFRILGDYDPESTSDMNKVFYKIDRLAQKTGAAIVIESSLEKLNRSVDTVLKLDRTDIGTLRAVFQFHSSPPIGGSILSWGAPLLRGDITRGS
jgi:RecA-family ATPase